jgi:hypothetical protein
MRLRNVEVIYADEPPDRLDKLAGVTDFERAGNRVQLKFKGDLNSLLAELTRNELLDLSIGHASLEDVFLEFYNLEGDEQQ